MAANSSPASVPLLAVPGDDEERVVDPERETHAREHVHDEDRQLELLRDDGRQSERDEDRDDRHQERDEAGDDRAEHEQEDDERGRQAELELALLEILLGEEVEVVVERLLARHRDLELAVLARLLDGRDDLFGLVLAEDRERHHRRVAILGDEPRRTVVEVRARLRERPYVALGDKRADEARELVGLDRETIGADDDDVADELARLRRKRLEPHGVRALGLRVVRRRTLGGEAVAEQQRDRRDCEDEHDDPRSDRPPRMTCARRCELSGRELHHAASACVVRRSGSKEVASDSAGRRLRGMNSASAAPMPTTTAPTQSAGTSPSLKVTGDS